MALLSLALLFLYSLPIHLYFEQILHHCEDALSKQIHYQGRQVLLRDFFVPDVLFYNLRVPLKKNHRFHNKPQHRQRNPFHFDFHPFMRLDSPNIRGHRRKELEKKQINAQSASLRRSAFIMHYR